MLGVSPSSYYAWLKRRPSPRRRRDLELLELIRRIHKEARGIYGAPRVWAELRYGHGIRCARKRVARLMREAGLQGICRRKRHGCTKRRENYEPYPDLVKRRFQATGPNQLWVADLTEHRTGEGKLCLASLIDVHSRRVVGWSMSDKLTAEVAREALDMALARRRPAGPLVHHSDHGSQYTAKLYTSRIRKTGLLGSMGTVGDALDNAVAESFYASLQTELLDRQSWKTMRQLRTEVFSYIEGFYNRRRRHSGLGYLSPEEFERRSAGARPKPEVTELEVAAT